MSDTLLWLQEWYLVQCNGDGEHEYGVEIGTLDNPGWRVEVDLVGTSVERGDFASIKVERSDNDWLFCEVVERKFKIACGPSNLAEALEAFRKWVTECAFEQRKLGRFGRIVEGDPRGSKSRRRLK
jgi:hypothetical protein